MFLVSNDDDSEESDSFSTVGEDIDVYLNHYRIPKLKNFGPNGANNLPKSKGNREQVKYNNEGKIMSLTELAAQKVACHLPFGQVEHFDPPVPEPMQCRIAFWSFPQDEEDVRLYTCLANGNADVFIRAEDLISLNCVCDMLQVGFHLSANVKSIQDSMNEPDCFRVAITFDRRRITSCCCSCLASTFWCQHAVAVCLQRIRKPQDVTLRAPVSESLQRLEKNQLQKFAQYLINELPQQILPAAQKLLDELLSGDEAVINQNPAAPDPTAGATINEQTSWCLDDTHLSMDIQKILLKQCTAQPTVCSDISALHSTAPPAANEYSQLLRPIRGREPEGLWNLISIVGEMMKRRDSNFFLLLEIMTQEVLKCDKVVTWWFETKVSLHSGSTIHYASTKNNSQCTSQYSCSNFCDEIVHLWQLAAMNPGTSAAEKKRLYQKFFDWHLDILKRHNAIPESNLSNPIKSNKRNFLELFPGFKPAMEGCLIDWSDWDDKKARLITVDEEPEAEKAKTTKSAKKRKKKSKASKQNSTEPKPSTSKTVDGEQSESSKIDLQESTENQAYLTEQQQNVVEVENKENDTPDVVSKNENIQVNDANDHHLEPLQQQELNENQEENLVEPEVPRIEQDLQVYYMERPLETPQKVEKSESLEDFIKVNIRRLNDPLEILYAKTKGLHAHGHLDEARKLALKASTEILNYPSYPTIKQVYTLPRRRKKKGSLDNQMSIVASEALTKIAFLCNVLMDDPENNHLVFRLILFGVEMKRSPAATKPLEVKLINQKHDLVMLLKSIALNEEELVILRDKAQSIRDGTCEQISDALTTLILGNYIFEALVLSKSPSCSNYNSRAGMENARSSSISSYSQPGQYQLEEHYMPPGDINQQPSLHSCDRPSLIVYGKLPHDASHGFHAALSALSAKVNLLEVDHPLLCEGTRRQRGELALSLLIHYKDDQEKLDLILKQLLDKDVVLSLQTQEGTERAQKKNSSPQDPNQPTEASAHFIFELAKTVLDKAGGNSLTSHLFRPQLTTQNGGRGIHRRLHMCTLRIALYALGLQNRTSQNWMQRTYNGRASFIHEQALEIGLTAIKFLCENWEGYLTPVEVAAIADKAGTLNDLETKRVAAEMAKSCLKYANYLDFNAVRHILAQCKDQSIEMIEEACNEIEQVAETDSVCADVLFATARAWYSLYEKLILDENHNDNNYCHLVESAPSEQDTGAADWLTGNIHQDIFSQYSEPAIHQMHWGVYSRGELIPTLYKPTYKHLEYVEAAYRVGMKAMDALKPSLHIGSKHNPKKEDDVLWLLALSKSLGRDCLYKFSQSAINNITNPHVLNIISSDLIMFFDFIKRLPYDHPARLDTLLPLIDKCLDRFVRQTKDLMKHISYDQKSYLETIIENAQNLTKAANTLSAAARFDELLWIVDSRKTKRFNKNYIDTSIKRAVNINLTQTIKQCACTRCKIGRINAKYLACNRELKTLF